MNKIFLISLGLVFTISSKPVSVNSSDKNIGWLSYGYALEMFERLGIETKNVDDLDFSGNHLNCLDDMDWSGMCEFIKTLGFNGCECVTISFKKNEFDKLKIGRFVELGKALNSCNSQEVKLDLRYNDLQIDSGCKKIRALEAEMPDVVLDVLLYENEDDSTEVDY